VFPVTIFSCKVINTFTHTHSHTHTDYYILSHGSRMVVIGWVI